MLYRTLGKTGLRVSLMSFGSGGPSNLGQPAGLSDQGQRELLRRCLELGVNFFDTSTNYGQSEEILGRDLEGVPRDSYILGTKWSHSSGGGVYREADDLAASVESSLRALKTDYVDVMQFHGVLPEEYDDVVARLYPEMTRLREQGKIRYIGFSERFVLDPEHKAAVMALKTHPELWDTIMLKYGILNQQAAREALPLAQQHNVGIINMAAVRVKLPRPDQLEELIEEWKQKAWVPADGVPEKDPLGWLVHDEVDSVVSAGYKFAAERPGVSTVLSGTSSIEHLEHNAAALERPYLPEADSQRLRELFSEVAVYA